MRLGAEVFGTFGTAGAWADAVARKGYRAAFCPIDCGAGDATVQAYRAAAAAQDIVIGEVGVWNNPLHPNPAKRGKAVRRAVGQLALAEAVGAKCCVNVAGSYNPKVWYGPHPRNFTKEAMDEIVASVRYIIDSVNPQSTFYTLEPSPWLYPDGIETTLELLRRVGRRAFAVHWDPVNMMCSPARYYQNDAYLRQCMDAFGDKIKSVHLKDVYMDESFTLHIQERPAGQGILDYDTLITGLDAIDPEMPAFVEHLDTEAEVDAAVAHVRGVMNRLEKGEGL